MYTFTKGYPQSDVLKQHPDYLDYYLPIADTHARYYADGSLENGTPVSVVYTQLDESVSNKYLCFIGGDTPVCIVESDVRGPTCIVLKESYGNAFVPFLTSHYGRIIVIDPREFNQEGKPTRPRRLRRRPGRRRPDRHQLPLHDQQQSLRPLPQRIGGGQISGNAAAPAFPLIGEAFGAHSPKASPSRGGGSAKPRRRGCCKFVTTSQSASQTAPPARGAFPLRRGSPLRPFGPAPLDKGSLGCVQIKKIQCKRCSLTKSDCTFYLPQIF